MHITAGQKWFRPLIICLVIANGPRLALGHDELEITVDGWLASDAFVLEVVLTRQAALEGCLAETGNRRLFGPNQFDEVKEAFESCGAEWFALATSDGEAIEPKSVSAHLNRESHVVVQIVYRALDESSTLEARLFDQYERSGYRVWINIWNGRKIIANKQLSADDRLMEVTSANPVSKR